MQKLGRYEIVKELGRGAMGAVFLARDPVIDRTVAIKTILASVTGTASERENYRARFFREAQAAGKLSHPGIVTIHDIGEEEATQTPYIVMEFVPGRTLDEAVEETGTMATETTLDIVQQVAEALNYAHAQGIVHRDIKPANILLTVEGRAKITDFGVARLRVAQMTVAGEIFGTPAYMAPEQFEGGRADGRSDLFSLGVMLYWMLTGQKPFQGDDMSQVMFQVVYQDPRPATDVNARLSGDFSYVCSRALAKKPEQRYQTGREMADDLSDLQAGRPPRSKSAAGVAPSAAPERTVMARPQERRADPAGAEKTVFTGPPSQAAAPTSAPIVTVDWARVREGAQSAGEKAAAFARFVWERTRVLSAWLWQHLVAMAQTLPGRTQTAIAWSRQMWLRIRAMPPRTQGLIAGALLTPLLVLLVWWTVGAMAPKTNLNLTLRHDLRVGQLIVEVDGSELAQAALTGTESRRLGLFRRIEGSYSTVLRVPVGKRRVVVRVVSTEESFDQTRELEAEFAEGEEPTLVVVCESRRGLLSISLR